MSKTPMSCAAALAALIFFPVIAEPQAAGPEFRVNSYTTSTQVFPSVAIDGNGNFVVAWESNTQDGSGYGVFAQRYAAGGSALGGEFRVNSYTTDRQFGPSVGMDDAGNFVVAWESYAQDGSTSGVFAQRYAAGGAAAGGEFRVNTYTTSYQSEPQLSRSPSGSFVVTWTSRQDGSNDGIFGQRYDAGGSAAGSEFRVNTYTTGIQFRSHAAMDVSGRFVVVWTSLGQDGSYAGIFGQRYDSSGSPAGPEFQVNTYTTQNQESSSVAITDSGAFVVVWDGGPGILAQRYDASGGALGGPFTVETASAPLAPRAAMDAYGNFVVVWKASSDGSGFGTFARRFNADGAALGTSFRVNTYTTSDQDTSSVAMNPHGNFVVTWSSAGQDGGGDGIFGQRYAFGPSRIADFDGDSKTDITVYHPPSGLWFVRRSSTGSTDSFGYGGTGYDPVPGDYDGDGANDAAVFHSASGLWFIRQSTTGTTLTVGFGGPGATTVPRDYDGDGMTDVAVYYESAGLWYVRQSSTGTTFSIGYGGTGYRPVPMDYDGDGKVDIAVYHQASGLWFIRYSSTGATFSLGFGGPGFTAVPRDFDGDGKADLAVYHEASGLWYVRQSSTGTTVSLGYGGTGYSPVPADYDGDGKADHAVYHAASGLWFIRQSTTGTTFSLGFGGSGFNPVNSTPAPLPDLVITIVGISGSMSYSPNPANARVGQSVIWRNSDSVTHTATADGGAFDTGFVNPGASSAAIRMDAEGTFSYHCNVHPTMTGTLTVSP